MNDLEPVRPLVWINEVPWHEMDVNGELTLQTNDPVLQQIELELRRLIYQWNHFPADMVVSPFIPCHLEIRSTGIGLLENVDVIMTDPANDIISRHYHPQIVNPEDIDKINMPVVTCDWEATEEKYDRMNSDIRRYYPGSKRRKTGNLVRPLG